MRFEFVITKQFADLRLDKALITYFEGVPCRSDQQNDVYSRSQVSRWIAEGYVSVNSQIVTKPSFHPSVGEVISGSIPKPKAITIQPDQTMTLDIVYEDYDILVINKPAGLVVHPGAGQQERTLVHGLVFHLGDQLQKIGDRLRPGIVHRLDKGTSGLMVVAKNEVSYQGLLKQFVPPRRICRTYLAFVGALPTRKGLDERQLHGHSYKTQETAGVIDLPIGRHRVLRTKMAVVEQGGRNAQTRWKLLEIFSKAFLLELSLETGRTHQIRVHLQAVGASIIGDALYGYSLKNFPPELSVKIKHFGRQALHAAKLSFIHPVNQKEMHFEAKLPADMVELIEMFRRFNV